MDDNEWFTLAELTQRLGGLVWVEDNVAKLLEVWSQIDPHAPSAIAFATEAGHHRWHAEVIRGCLATSPALLADDVVVAPTQGWVTSLDSLHRLTDIDATSARLKALAKVIAPWINRETSVLMELSRPVSDAAMVRWLGFVDTDHRHDNEAIVGLLASRSGDAVRFDDHLAVNALDLH